MQINSLINNTVIYMIGSFFSKILNLALLPYISIKLSSEQYGVFDYIQTLTGLLIPICTVQCIEAAFRYSYTENEDNKRKILTNVLVIVISGIIVTIIVLLVTDIYSNSFRCLLLLYLIPNIILNMYQRIARCYNKNKVFAVSGTLQTFFMLVLQFVFLDFFLMKEDGLIFAFVISVIFSVLYIEYHIRFIRQLDIRYVNIASLRKILLFSCPLIPNSISWWGVSSLNRMIIVSQIGYAANGIFSMSSKLSSIVTMLGNTFQLALQEYMLANKDKEDRKILFSNIFNNILVILGFIFAIGTLLQQIFFVYFISKEYFDSFYYIPFSMLGAIFSAMSSFYGIAYSVYEKTSGAFITTSMAAFSNLLLCFFTIDYGKLYAVSFASSISYLCLWIIRHCTMKEYFEIYLQTKKVICFIFLVCSSVFIYYINNILCSVITVVIYTSLCCIFFRKKFMELIRFKRRKSNAII